MTRSKLGRRTSSSCLSPMQGSPIGESSELQGEFGIRSSPLCVQEEALINVNLELQEGKSIGFKLQENGRHGDRPCKEIVNRLQSTLSHNNGLQHRVGSRDGQPQAKANEDGEYQGRIHRRLQEEGRFRENIHQRCREHGRCLQLKQEKSHFLATGVLVNDRAIDPLGHATSEQMAEVKDQRAAFFVNQGKQEEQNPRSQLRGNGHGHLHPYGHCSSHNHSCSNNHLNTAKDDILAKAKELKEEGNRQFQKKNYLGAMALSKQALDLIPSDHSDRAVFYTNRAACLMQMQPVQYDAAIEECTHALKVQTGFSRALLRRARAFEAVGELELALDDAQTLLQEDGSHVDALDLVKRLQLSLQHQKDAHAELKASHFSRSSSAVYRRTEKPRVSASRFARSTSFVLPGSQLFETSQIRISEQKVVHLEDERPVSSTSSPVINMSDHVTCPQIEAASPQTCLAEDLMQISQTHPASSQTSLTDDQSQFSWTQPASSSETSLDDDQTKLSQTQPASSQTSLADEKTQFYQTQLTSSQTSFADEQSQASQMHPAPLQTILADEKFEIKNSDKVTRCDDSISKPVDPVVQLRQMKLIYHGDIRLAEMPAGCEFTDLRKLVKARFPSSRAVLIKFMDFEGDLVTITCTKELRLAEFAANSMGTQRATMDSIEDGLSLSENCKAAIGLHIALSALQPIRLHVVEVTPEQEPLPKGEDTSIVTNPEDPELKENAKKKETGETKQISGFLILPILFRQIWELIMVR